MEMPHNGEMSLVAYTQGTVLGPVLFVIYINDLPSVVKSETYMFADDTKIFAKSKESNNSQTIQDDLNNLQLWSDTWLLKFHPEKCKVMSIGRTTNQQEDLYLYKQNEVGTMETVNLQVVTSEKDLGIVIDNKLQFGEHIQEITKKANNIMGIIRRNVDHVDKETFTPLYKHLVRSHLEYGQPVWNPYLKKDIIQVESVQRNATIQVLGLSHLSYTERL